jgi:Flp pilus assembly protein TadG
MRNSTVERLRADERGNIAMMFALSMPVFFLGGGLAIDYARAATIRTQLQAAADAAALAAVTPAMMGQSTTAAQAAALASFEGAVAKITGLNAAPNVTIDVTSSATNALLRNVSIVYTGGVNNMFASLIAMPVTTIGGQVHSSAQAAPNIDFTVLLDNSPSMALPQSQAGIASMISLTASQDGGNGCALACHMANTGNSDSAGNPYWNPGNASVNCNPSSGPRPAGCVQMDNYELARANNIPLRIDNLSAGMTALLGDADGYRTSLAAAAGTAPNYSFTVDTFDSPYAIGFTNIMTKNVNTYSSAWSSASANLSIMEMWQNSSMCGTSGGNPCGTGIGGNDVQTNWDNALNSVNAQMPTPGNGSNAVGDTPQGVLFIVTDGVEDELNGGSRLIQAINTNGAHDYCADIKARGIKIAILYTTYLPLTTNAFYNGNVAPFQAKIAPQLQACATSGLFLQAQVGQDLGEALGTLFNALNKGSRLVGS